MRERGSAMLATASRAGLRLATVTALAGSDCRVKLMMSRMKWIIVISLPAHCVLAVALGLTGTGAAAEPTSKQPGPPSRRACQ